MDGKEVNLVSTGLRSRGNCCRCNFEEYFVHQGHVIMKDCEIFPVSHALVRRVHLVV